MKTASVPSHRTKEASVTSHRNTQYPLFLYHKARDTSIPKHKQVELKEFQELWTVASYRANQ